MNPKTQESIEVKEGQIWRSLDKNANGRHVKVLTLGTKRYGLTRATAKVIRCAPDGSVPEWPPSPKSTLSVDRMHAHATGWALVG